MQKGRINPLLEHFMPSLMALKKALPRRSYVSNVPIIFYGSMQLSCQTLDVLYAFYIFFGTNLLTQCQVLVPFFPCF